MTVSAATVRQRGMRLIRRCEDSQPLQSDKQHFLEHTTLRMTKILSPFCFLLDACFTPPFLFDFWPPFLRLSGWPVLCLQVVCWGPCLIGLLCLSACSCAGHLTATTEWYVTGPDIGVPCSDSTKRPKLCHLGSLLSLPKLAFLSIKC